MSSVIPFTDMYTAVFTLDMTDTSGREEALVPIGVLILDF